MSQGTVIFEQDGDIGIITVDRPSRRNALSQDLWRAFVNRTSDARAAGVRVLILTGAGGHFSAGADLNPDNPLTHRIAPAVIHGDRGAGAEVIRELKAVMEAVSTFPAPTIAAVEGSCIGGGLELALACDLRVASREARIGLPEVRVGFIPDLGGTVRLTRLVGTGRAALLTLSGRLLSGAEAASYGLVEVSTDPGQALPAALDLARDILLGSPTAVRAALGVIRQTQDLPLPAALEAETEAGIDAMVSGDLLPGVQAFLTRSRPPWAPR